MNDATSHSSPAELLHTWVDTYGEQLLRHTERRVRDADAAQDLVQEVFLAAWEGLPTFREQSSPRTWLFAILDIKIKDYYRKQLRNPLAQNATPAFFDENGSWLPNQVPQQWSDHTHVLDNPIFVRILDECLQRLSPTAHAGLTAKYLEQKSGESICQELGITTTSYWQILHRARIQLRACLEFNWFAKDGQDSDHGEIQRTL